MRMIWAASLPGTRLAAATGADGAEPMRTERRHDDRNERFCAQLENAHVVPFFQHVAVSATATDGSHRATGDGGRRERPGRGRGRGDVGRSPGGTPRDGGARRELGNRARGELFGFSGSSCVCGVACGAQDTGRSEIRTSVDLRICGPHFGAMEGHAHPPVVVVNPVASRVADSSRRGRLVESVVAAVEARTGQTPIVVDASPEAAREALTEAGARAAPLAVIVGGDGTIRDAASALAGAGVPIAIVPAGTGNVFAAALGIPRRAIDAIRLIGEGRPVAVDLGSASWGSIVDGRQLDPEGSMAFAVACGIGFDARVMSTASTELKRRLRVLRLRRRDAPRGHPAAAGRLPDRGRRRGPRDQRSRRPRRELRSADPGPDRAALPDRPDRRPARRDRRDGAGHPGRTRRRRRVAARRRRFAAPGPVDAIPRRPGPGRRGAARTGPDRRRRPRGRLARCRRPAGRDPDPASMSVAAFVTVARG